MSRTYKGPWHWNGRWNGWDDKPWKRQSDRRRFVGEHCRELQRKFRQATRLALIARRECPPQPPIDWYSLT